MQHMPLNPRASTYFNGAAQTQGFEFRITGKNRPNLELVIEQGMRFYVTRGEKTSRSARDDFGFGPSSKPTPIGTGFDVLNRMIGHGLDSWLLSKYENNTSGNLGATLAAPDEGDIIAINMDEVGGSILAKRSSYFAGTHTVRPSWGLDLQMWHWLGLPSPILGEGKLLWQQIYAPKDDKKQQQANKGGKYKFPELPGREHIEEAEMHLPSKNWAFLYAPGDVRVIDLTPDHPQEMIRRGSVLALTPHVRRGAWFTKSGLLSNALNLVLKNDGESFLSPTFTTRGNDIIDAKGPCRLWLSNDL